MFCSNCDSCKFGYTGLLCDQLSCFSKSSLDVEVCSGKGSCIEPNQCSCITGVTGSYCQLDCHGKNGRDGCSRKGNCYQINVHAMKVTLNATNIDVCSRKGQCISRDGCLCQSGYTGLECESHFCNSIAHNSPSVCSGKGSCISPNNCSCIGSYTGHDCQFTSCFGKSSSDLTVCSGKGTCIASDKCVCSTGYTGSYCQFQTCFGLVGPNGCSNNEIALWENVCQYPICYGSLSTSSEVCSANGKCEAPNKCICNTKYYGNQCEIFDCNLISRFDSNVCSGKGSCISIDQCHCNAVAVGVNCNDFICNGQIGRLCCSSRGNCSNPFQCSCDVGFLGSQCEVSYCNGIISNSSNVCNSRGSCVDGNCKCDSGYSGNECEGYSCNSIAASDFKVCATFGSCIGPNVCQCNTGRSGPNCEFDVCFSKTGRDGCDENGDCIAPDKCQCDIGRYTGNNCNLFACNSLSPLNPMVCSSNGKCVESNQYVCNKGYVGMNDCSPCPRNTYNPTEGSLKCLSCPNGYHTVAVGSTSSLDCIKCEDGYFRDLRNDTCVPCLPGTYYTHGTCEFCATNMYSPHYKSEKCFGCETGHICPIGSKRSIKKPTDQDIMNVEPKIAEDIFQGRKNANYIKIGSVSFYFVVAFLISSIMLVLFYILCGRSCKKLDFLYAESHMLKNYEHLTHFPTSFGGMFTVITVLCIFGMVVSSCVDFVLMNIQERQSLVVQKSTDQTKNHFIIRITSKNFENCTKTVVDNHGFRGSVNLTHFITNSTCISTWECKDCEFVGFQQDVCFNFSSYSSYLSYSLQIPSILETQKFLIQGEITPPNNQIFSKTTIIFATIYRALYIELFGGFGSAFFSLLHYISNDLFKDIEHHGFIGYVTNIDVSSNTTSSGFQNFKEFAIFEEYNRQSLTNFIAQIASLSATIIAIVGVIFKVLENYCWSHLRILKKKIRKKFQKKQEDENLKVEVETEMEEPDENLEIKNQLSYQSAHFNGRIQFLEHKIRELEVDSSKKFERKIDSLKEEIKVLKFSKMDE
eukprot:gene9833-2155_t